MTDFDTLMKDLGVRQARANLPLVFLQNPNIKQLQTPDRIKAQELAEPTLNIIKQMLESQNLTSNVSNMVDMLLSNTLSYAVFNNSTIDLNEVQEYTDKMLNNPTAIEVKDSQYLEHLSKLNLGATYVSLNQSIINNCLPDVELTTRNLNYINRESVELYNHHEDYEIKTMKLDLERNKVTTMTKSRTLLSLVPIAQVFGYVKELSYQLQSGLYQVVYYRRDFKPRIQYVSKDYKEVVSKIYPDQDEAFRQNSEFDTSYTDSNISDNYIESLSYLGYFSLPDLGRAVTNPRDGVAKILRKLTFTNFLSIKKIDDPTKVIKSLNIQAEYDLDKVSMYFENNLQGKTQDDLLRIAKLMQEQPNVIYVHDTDELLSFSIMNSLEVTTNIYTSTGLRALLDIMLNNTDLFKLPRWYEEQQSNNAKLAKAVYSGDDILDLMNF